MAEFFPALTSDHRAFIAKQPVFFVATAAEGARINLSPKGMDSTTARSPISTSRDPATRPTRILSPTGGSRSCSAPSTIRR